MLARISVLEGTVLESKLFDYTTLLYMEFPQVHISSHPVLFLFVIQSPCSLLSGFQKAVFYTVSLLSVCLYFVPFSQALDIFNHFFGEGNGTLLQYFCLENPMGGGAW